MCRYAEPGVKTWGGGLEAKTEMLMKKELKYRTIDNF